jgi:hypothetical protein
MAFTKPLFAPIPLRAMSLELSGLLLRVLICVAAHDRMSLVKRTGQGCRASKKRMTQMVGCSFARLCWALPQLVALGLLAREKVGRQTVYRVVYNDEDMLLFRNVSPPNVTSDRVAKHITTGCPIQPSSHTESTANYQQYIPLNGRRESNGCRQNDFKNRDQNGRVNGATSLAHILEQKLSPNRQ